MYKLEEQDTEAARLEERIKELMASLKTANYTELSKINKQILAISKCVYKF